MEVRAFRAKKTTKAMRTFWAVCILMAVLSLGSCGVLNYIFGSVFPATAMLAKAQADLSGVIAAGQGYSYHVRVVETGGYGYVVVVGNQSSAGVAYVYDLDLNLLATIPNLQGNGVTVDAGGYIALGNIRLIPGTLVQYSTIPSVNSINTTSDEAGGVDGFIMPTTGYLATQLSFNTTTANALTGTSFNSSWTNEGTVTSTTALCSGGLQVSALLDDGVPADNLIVVLRTSGNNGNSNSNTTCYFVPVSKSNFIGGTAQSSPSRTNLEPTSFGFANGCIMAYDLGAASFVRINPADGSTQSSFYSATDPSNVTFAYRVNGGSFYGFDQKSRILTKYGTWW
jgi:hypothetical protein